MNPGLPWPAPHPAAVPVLGRYPDDRLRGRCVRERARVLGDLRLRRSEHGPRVQTDHAGDRALQTRRHRRGPRRGDEPRCVRTPELVQRRREQPLRDRRAERRVREQAGRVDPRLARTGQAQIAQAPVRAWPARRRSGAPARRSACTGRSQATRASSPPACIASARLRRRPAGGRAGSAASGERDRPPSPGRPAGRPRLRRQLPAGRPRQAIAGTAIRQAHLTRLGANPCIRPRMLSHAALGQRAAGQRRIRWTGTLNVFRSAWRTSSPPPV